MESKLGKRRISPPSILHPSSSNNMWSWGMWRATVLSTLLLTTLADQALPPSTSTTSTTVDVSTNLPLRNAQARNEFLLPSMQRAQYGSANNIVQSLKMDENIVREHERYALLPGTQSLGQGIDMLSGMLRTKILRFHPTAIHSMSSETSKLQRKYRVPKAVNVEERDGATSQSLWEEWPTTDKYRKSIAEKMGWSQHLSALSNSQQVEHVSSTLRTNLMIATRTIEEIMYYARTQPYSTGMSTMFEAEEEDEEDGEVDKKENEKKQSVRESEREQDKLRSDAGMWPLTSFVEAVCGQELSRDQHPEFEDFMPDCIMSEDDFVVGTHEKMRPLEGRNELEMKFAMEGEARRCTTDDMRRLMKFYHQYGTHIVIGVAMGGSIEEYVVAVAVVVIAVAVVVIVAVVVAAAVLLLCCCCVVCASSLSRLFNLYLYCMES